MMHSWDPQFSVEDNERFFKIVLKNALKRKETKNIRSSSQRKTNQKKQSQVIQTEGENQKHGDETSVTEKNTISEKVEGENRAKINTKKRKQTTTESFSESAEENEEQTNTNVIKQNIIKRQRGNNEGEIEETTKKQKIYERSNADNSNKMEEQKKLTHRRKY